MKIAVTAESDQGLGSPVSYHFGRCPYYIFVNVEDSKLTDSVAVPNISAANHSPGELPVFIRRNGVGVLLTSGMGSQAVDFFTQYGIEVVTGAQGTVQQAIEQYLSGQLRGYSPCPQSQEHGHGHNH